MHIDIGSGISIETILCHQSRRFGIIAFSSSIVPVSPFSFHREAHVSVSISLSVRTSATEATSAPDALLELLYFNNLRSVDAFDDQLCDAVALPDFEIGLGVVEEQNLDLATVIGIDHASAGVDEVLGGKTGARSDTAILI